MPNRQYISAMLRRRPNKFKTTSNILTKIKRIQVKPCHQGQFWNRMNLRFANNMCLQNKPHDFISLDLTSVPTSFI